MSGFETTAAQPRAIILRLTSGAWTLPVWIYALSQRRFVWMKVHSFSLPNPFLPTSLPPAPMSSSRPRRLEEGVFGGKTDTECLFGKSTWKPHPKTKQTRSPSGLSVAWTAAKQSLLDPKAIAHRSHGGCHCLPTIEPPKSPGTGPDGHVTRYDLDWLVKNSYEGQKQEVIQPRVLWNAKLYQDAQLPSVDFQGFLETKEGLKKFLQNFLLYGIAFVENVPPTQEHTEKLARRVSLIRETIYGRMWYFTSDFSRGDTAYTKLALDRHTDTTYFQEPCGIQVFHCLKHEGTGGRTLLVDGFYAAQQVLQRAPEEFDLLSQVPLKHEYIENVGQCHNHMIGVGPILNIYPWNKELYLIRYNNYDRAVINTVPYDVVRRWYAAHRTLTTELRRPENELWVKLKPGKVLFIDNWRVLHGRESFTGYRQLCGCYLTRDDVLNTARILGLHA
ncbi:trimethyllysine dioxygenase, mitochondrial isoform X1 [Rattus norvegicus]|uniref:Trimethyllysine dioxygenase, mitochondrial n=1 Tax=Rattus norvegicus TaxID=10116 RepID=A0A8L2QMT7_RAT|nr:trimethyllysine dioxygenase, mitochondrial isoform X1 [Rattus norvegicus]XP_038954325.1 trimethyllysine dioxygenase, mitochondrial isoform X1 [Rattus norvegicus]XP_038954326.1 trimethyllysine dioxygenase, mitochondrial isoform X1 [Rattus norvegicus]XP_038954327.1 trimethyllysine dioxygenase, mitochondrial isoform X1 [Rattus norvegicus]